MPIRYEITSGPGAQLDRSDPAAVTKLKKDAATQVGAVDRAVTRAKREPGSIGVGQTRRCACPPSDLIVRGDL